MSRVIHQLVQGSPEWVGYRAAYYNASEAAAMLGLDPKLSRAELVRMYAIGNEREFSDFVQRRLLDKGLEAEAAARPVAEQIIGEELYPIVASREIDGLPLSVSLDGATMLEDTTLEHKLINEELASALERGEIPEWRRPQCEQGLMVLEATRCLFMASNGTAESARYVWYQPDQALRDRIIAGWKQFREDVANYQHVEVLPGPAPAAQIGLPALSIRVDGALALTSNLDVFGEQLRKFIETIPAKPSTDQEFSDCEAAIKVLERAESALKAAEDSALAQTASVEQMRRTVASYNDLARTNRLMIEKLVKARKESIRAEIIQAGRDAFATHVAGLNKRLGRPYMPPVLTDFPGVVKGKKTVQSLRDAVDGELARAKLLANTVADQIQINMAELAKIAGDRMHAFPDAGQLVLKPPDDMAALARQRLAEIDERERKRLEAEREKIRTEEEAKARKQFEAQLPAPAPQQVQQQPHLPGTVITDIPEAAARVITVTPFAGALMGAAASAPRPRERELEDILGRIVTAWRAGDEMLELIEQAEGLLGVEVVP